MTPCVLDASVFAAALFGEPGGAQAASLVRRPERLIAPDLLHAELGNAIWRRWRRKELDRTEATELLATCLAVRIKTVASADLAEAALGLAVAQGCTVYDALYVALAVRENTQVVTLDGRLVTAFVGSPFAGNVRLLEP